MATKLDKFVKEEAPLLFSQIDKYFTEHGGTTTWNKGGIGYADFVLVGFFTNPALTINSSCCP